MAEGNLSLRSVMIKIIIEYEKCVSCGWCIHICPTGVIDTENEHVAPLNLEDCTGCLICEEQCPESAIEVQQV